ncbi:hypothetical protein AB7C87_02880 [Natrarchaeobius sp. A-rgal3]|uniref:hypothetical protein n=1 Tax=Natrarchaeobius versutus TaxID=1679078 RepID=UPI00351024E6
MALNITRRRRSLAISSVVYFGSAFIIGLPVAYAVYWVFVRIFNLLHLGWFVPSAGGIILVAAAFLIGMWVAGQVAERVVDRLS